MRPIVAQVRFDDLPLTVVETMDLRLTFAPTRGGRLLSVRAGDSELLWRNERLLDESFRPVVPVCDWPDGTGGMSTWANVGGSKTWPAPQGWDGDGQWPGPPDAVLDSGAWSLEVESSDRSAVVTMTSQDDARTGLRIIRSFAIPGTGLGFDQTTTFVNVSRRDVRWSIWEVCQVDTAAGAGRSLGEAAVVVPISRDSRVVDLGTWVGDVEGEQRGSAIRLPIGTGVAKRGFADVPGEVGYIGPDGEGLRLATRPVDGATYPDGGSQVEVWLQAPVPEPIDALGGLHPAAHLVELELLGPLTRLAPGETSELAITWLAAGVR